MHEQPQVAEKEIKKTPLEERLELIRSGYGNVGQVLEWGTYEIADDGKIKDSRNVEDIRPMIVKTNAGAIVHENRELVTERLSGCVGLVIQGPGFNCLVHLTPNSDLGYYYHRFPDGSRYAERTIQKVFAAIPKEVPRASLSVNIIANIPDETDSTYGRTKLTVAWERLEDNIKKLGVENIKRTELPMDETLLYVSPLAPHEAYVIGEKMEIGPDGEYVHRGEIIEQKIALG